MSYLERKEFIQQRMNREDIKADLWERWLYVTDLSSECWIKYHDFKNAESGINKQMKEVYKTQFTRLFFYYLRELRSFWILVKPHIPRTLRILKVTPEHPDGNPINALKEIDRELSELTKLDEFSKAEKCHSYIGKAVKGLFDLSPEFIRKIGETPELKRTKKPKIFNS